jgi:hypothetical protein
VLWPEFLGTGLALHFANVGNVVLKKCDRKRIELLFQTRGTNKEGKRWQTGKKIKVIKVRAVAAAAAAVSPAVVQAAVAAAVRVVADHPVVDSVAAVEAVEIADASLSYLQKKR